MTPPTPEELLRLAREAYAKLWAERERMVRDDEVDPTDIAQWDHYSVSGGMNNHAGRVDELDLGEVCWEHFATMAPTREALHAALLVLAGELDVAELLAERDRLRASLRLFVDHADGMNAAGARAAGDSLDAIAPGVGEYLEAQREALGIWADEFRELLPKEDP